MKVRSTTIAAGCGLLPLERLPEQVREDVIDGYFTPATAKASFGVSLNDDGTVNVKKTEQLRRGD